jgi:hypothetical protein
MSKRWDYFPEKDLIQRYRRVFSSEHGLEVLQHMLFDLGVFQPATSDGDAFLNEYGQRLLDILAGGEPEDYAIKIFVKQLMRQSLTKKGDAR